jgi:hypothetical protein
MRRWALVRTFLISAAAILIALASPAVAGESRGGEDRGPPIEDPPVGDNGGGGGGEGEGEHEPSVPEFDPSTAGAAFALLSGGALVLTSRRKRRLAS